MKCNKEFGGATTLAAPVDISQGSGVKHIHALRGLITLSTAGELCK